MPVCLSTFDIAKKWKLVQKLFNCWWVINIILFKDSMHFLLKSYNLFLSNVSIHTSIVKGYQFKCSISWWNYKHHLALLILFLSLSLFYVNKENNVMWFLSDVFTRQTISTQKKATNKRHWQIHSVKLNMSLLTFRAPNFSQNKNIKNLIFG